MTINTSNLFADGAVPAFPGVLATPKGDLLIQQFAPGSFVQDILPVFTDADRAGLTSLSPTLLTFTMITDDYGLVELRVSGIGLGVSFSTPGVPQFSGTVTGVDVLSDGAPFVSFSGMSEPADVLADALFHAPSGVPDALETIFAAYAITWDASAVEGPADWGDISDFPYGSPFGETLIGGSGTNTIFANDGDAIFPGTNTWYDLLHFFAGGDVSVDLSAAAAEPLSYYDLSFQFGEDYLPYNQGVVVNIGLTGGTVEYGNAGDRGTVTLTGVDALTIRGGFSVFSGGDADDVVSVQGDADLYFDYNSSGGDNTFTGGLQFDRLTLRGPGGITHRIDGYGPGGAHGAGVDGNGDVTTFSAVDQIRGSRNDDTFYGGDGDDYFITDRGSDLVFAGGGFDQVRYNRNGLDSINVDLAAHTASGVWYGAAFTDTLHDVEYIRGTDNADEILGSAADERLDGMAGIDVIDGRFGADLLISGEGADLMRMGGADADSADGDADTAAERLPELNGDTIEQIGAEDTIFVVDAALTDDQVRLTGNLLEIDGDGDGSFESAIHVFGPAIDGAVPVLTQMVDVDAPGDDDLYSGTAITFAPPGPKAIGEVVQLTVGTSWQTLSFANTYTDAVVFALAPTLNEVESAATRFKNITATGAEIRLQEPKKVFDDTSNPGDHVAESVTLLVLEKGVHTLEDGTVIQVGELETSKLYVKGFETVEFAEDFDAAPSIFSQVQTLNGTDFIISRQRNPDAGGFELTMQEEQADNLNHATETVGWFAIEHGGGSLSTMDWQAGSSSQNVNGNLTSVYFNERFDEKPLVMAALASYNGTDTSSPRIGSIKKNAFTAMALEDQSHDEETFHGHEVVDWMAFSNEGLIYEGAPLAPTVKIAESGVGSVGDAGASFSFASAFANPVVIVTITSMNEVDAAVARVSNVTSTGFDVRVQEADSDDGAHAVEDISWVVVEAGTWQLADGTLIQAGLEDIGTTTRQGFTSISYDTAFRANPAVLSQVQTENDPAFVKTRMKDVRGPDFQIALEEEEAANWGSHGTETVGWLAVDMGLASDADGFAFEAGSVSTNHSFKAETLAGVFDGVPGVVAGMASFGASDTGAARLQDLSATGFDIKVEEDISRDAETGHGAEEFHWIALNGDGEIWGDALV